MYFLALETSCDETAAAIFDEALRVHASVVASQLALHARFGGVVPEVAARAHLTQLLPVVDAALREAGIRLTDLGAVAVMNRPGLVGALLVAVSAAKMLALALEIPLIDVNHIEAHIYACRLAAGRDIFPCLGLVVSGGHTTLFDCATPLEFRAVGRTIDDAAGEAFDKVAALLGLGFPGGPAVEQAARGGKPTAYDLPRSFLHEDRLDFSFSGLKTAVRYLIRDLSGGTNVLAPAQTADVAASFQQAVIDVLTSKCRQAMRRSGATRLAVGGGVAANSALRASLAAMVAEVGGELFIPTLALCTDNAAMAAQAVEKWRAGLFAPLDLDAVAS